MKISQLVFDNNLNIVSDVINKYYNSIDEMPDNLKKYLNDLIDNSVLFDFMNDSYYCPKCLNELNNNKCNNCNKEYDVKKYLAYSDEANCSVLYFDIIENEVIIYSIFIELINRKYYWQKKIEIEDIIHVRNDGLFDIKNNKFYSYSKYKEIIDNLDNMQDENFGVFDYFNNCYDYIYLDNIDKLKESNIYKYSYIWEGKNYLSNVEKISLEQITFFPIYLKQFEYLIKLGLINLAFTIPNDIDDKLFIKKHLKFMQENNIDYKTYRALKLVNKEDNKILEFTKSMFDIVDYETLDKMINDFLSIEDLYNYFLKKNLKQNNINDYFDYVECLKKLKLDVHDKKILYPNNFIAEHNRLYLEVALSSDKNIDKKISNLSEILNLNTYCDDKYIIFPAKNIDGLIDESSQMANCVRTYHDKISNGYCQIYFMRLKENPSKSLVTIEVRNNKVVQAREKYNRDINDEEKEIIKKFEKMLIPILLEK